MQRRVFLQTTGLVGLGTWLGCSNSMNTAIEKTPYLDNLGIQLWTVRDQLAKDPLATLTAIKNHGYKQVELMNLGQLDVMGSICKDLGLDIKCGHIDWTAFVNKEHTQDDFETSVDQLIAKASKNGLSHLTFAYWSKEHRSKLDDYKNLTDKLNLAGEKCNEAGMKFGYHNHSFEFQPMENSTGYDVLRKNVDADKMQFELDVFWASIAGVDPLALMKEMKGRIHLLHLKDRMKGSPVELDESKVAHETFKELGAGMVDIKAVIELAEAHKVDYCHVEQDQSPDPIHSIGVSRKYLETV